VGTVARYPSRRVSGVRHDCACEPDDHVSLHGRQGSTRLLQRLGRERYAAALTEQLRLLRDVFGAHGGEELDTQGDSFLVAFQSAADAVTAAVAAHRALARHPWPDGVELRTRVGIHSGEAAANNGRYVGLAVHRAARVCAVAHGGQVLLSSATRELVADELGPEISLRDLGLVQLKDFDRPERIAQVEAEGLHGEFPPLSGAAEAPSLMRFAPLVRIRWDVLRDRLRARRRARDRQRR
jgi:class 3 adenylate cyclase